MKGFETQLWAALGLDSATAERLGTHYFERLSDIAADTATVVAGALEKQDVPGKFQEPLMVAGLQTVGRILLGYAQGLNPEAALKPQAEEHGLRLADMVAGTLRGNMEAQRHKDAGKARLPDMVARLDPQKEQDDREG